MMSYRIISSWFCIVTLCLLINSIKASHDEIMNLPTAAIVGTVFCDSCFENGFSMKNDFISGATVAVECGIESLKPTFHEEAKTNEKGEFQVHLPMSISKDAKTIKGCSVKLIKSSDSNCAEASTTTTSLNSVRLKSRSEQGTHIFSVGFLAFKPLKQPSSCNQKSSDKIHSSMKLLNTVTTTITLPLVGLPVIGGGVPKVPVGLPVGLPGLPGLPAKTMP